MCDDVPNTNEHNLIEISTQCTTTDLNDFVWIYVVVYILQHKDSKCINLIYFN